ncbi:MAG: tRNA (adenine-N1)-methyltransferase [Promethearchaeia archaeon]
MNAINDSSDHVIKKNSIVFLILDNRRRWIVKVKPGENFQTHRGYIEFDDIIGKPYGSVVFSRPRDTQGYKFYVLRPLISDYVQHIRRKTQIIYPEDAGLILMYSGIGPGSKVLEAGCGSGALTCILGAYVGSHGHIYSYDVRHKSLQQAKHNVKKVGLDEVVSIQEGDIIEDDFEFQNIDSVVLDLAQPWKAIKKVKKYLKLSGTVVSFSPTIEQVKKTYFAFKKQGFFEINACELLKRDLQIKENATRPNGRMIGHTGYLIFARKIADQENPYRGIKPEKPEKVSFEGMPLGGGYLEEND